MSNTSYKQIIPATDWYFRHDNVSGVAGKSTVYQLAAWALKENGEVVGLVTVRDDPLSLVIICIKNNSPMMKKSGRRDAKLYSYKASVLEALLACLVALELIMASMHKLR
ncbi:TPA: hypothetical protein ACUS0M_004682 [Escherichia coli]